MLTRNAAAFASKAPHLASASGGRRCTTATCARSTFPDGAFSHVIHAATDARARRCSDDDRLRMFDTIVDGTRRTLEFARHAGAARFLLTSSGAVYGRQPPDLTHVPEDYAGGPDPTRPDARPTPKASAPPRCSARCYADADLQPTIARCFAFVGPYLPLDAHFAVGNFIRDALAGGPIRITGDGTPYRSYLYAADLAVWLWTILLRGAAAAAVQRRLGGRRSRSPIWPHAVARRARRRREVAIARPAAPRPRPSATCPARAEHAPSWALRSTVDLEEALTRTLAWHRARRGIDSCRQLSARCRSASRRIGPGEPCYVIAEVGINHNGDLAIAKQLVDAAVAAGADAVKFQKRKLRETYREEIIDQPRHGEQGLQYIVPLLIEFELSDDAVPRAVRTTAARSGSRRCARRGTARSVDFLETCDLAAYKIGSPDLTNFPLIEYVAATGQADAALDRHVDRRGGPPDAGVPRAVRRRVRAVPLRQHLSRRRRKRSTSASWNGCASGRGRPVGYSGPRQRHGHLAGRGRDGRAPARAAPDAGSDDARARSQGEPRAGAVRRAGARHPRGRAVARRAAPLDHARRDAEPPRARQEPGRRHRHSRQTPRSRARC